MKLSGVLVNSIQVPLVIAFLAWTAMSGANEVSLTEDMPYLDVDTPVGKVRIERIQDEENVISGGFAKTSRKCPPFCIHPMDAAPGVTTVGEIELLDFMVKDLARGTGLLVDSRTPSWHNQGTIPGAVNVPFTACSADLSDPEFIQAMEIFGVRRTDTGELDYSEAKDLLMFCNGPWCDQSPRAIKGLMRRGYPPGKMSYYRGGMQMWQILGLTTIPGVSEFN